MAVLSDSYEMIRWVPFERRKPPIGHPIIVFPNLHGVVQARLDYDGLNTGGITGHFTHWADRIQGPSRSQQWLDKIISWVR